MDVETLDVVLRAPTSLLERGLAKADSLFLQTKQAAAGMEAEIASVGRTAAAAGDASLVAAGKHGKQASALRTVEREGRGAASSMLQLGRAGAFASNAFLGGIVAGSFLHDIYTKTISLEEAQGQLGSTVTNTGGDWRRQGAEVEGYLSHLSDASKFLETDLTPALGTLDAATGSLSKSERDLTLATDISRSGHQKLGTVVHALALAESGRTTGLSRLGIVLPKVTTAEDALRTKLAQLRTQHLQVSAATKSEATIRAKAADGLTSFNRAVDELKVKYAGADKVFAKSHAGSLANFHKDIEEIDVALGKVLVPDIDKGIHVLSGWVQKQTDSGKAAHAMKEGVDALKTGYDLIAPPIKFATGLVGGFGHAIEIFLGIKAAQMAIGFARGIATDVLALKQLGEKAIVIGARILGMGAASTEAAATTEAEVGGMDASIAGLQGAVDRLVLSIEAIGPAAVSSAGRLDLSVGTSTALLNTEAAAAARLDGALAGGAAAGVAAIGAETAAVGGLGAALLGLAGPAAILATIALGAQAAAPYLTRLGNKIFGTGGRVSTYAQYEALPADLKSQIPASLYSKLPGAPGTPGAPHPKTGAATVNRSAGFGTDKPQATAVQKAAADQKRVEDEINKILAGINSGTSPIPLTAAQKRAAANRAAAAAKRRAAAAKKAHQAAIGRQGEKILGLGPGGMTTTPGAEALRMHERSILLAEVKKYGGDVRQYTRTPLEQLVKDVEKIMGADLPKAASDSLDKINRVLKLKFLPADVRENIRSRLAQIQATMKAATGLGSSYKAVTAASLTAGLGLSPEQRRIEEQRIAQALAHGGKVPTMGAAGGVAITSKTRTSTAAEQLQQHFHGPITIIVSGADDPKKTAREIRMELLKHAERNSVQLRGRFSGRSVGLG